MKPLHYPILAILPFLFVSCEKKTAGQGGDAASAETTSETIVLARKDFLPPVGTIVTRGSSMDMAESVLKVKAGPQEMEGTATQKASARETIEIVSADKVRREVVSKMTAGKMTINGNDQPTGDKTDPLQGKAVILERTDGKWTAALESGEPDEEQRKGMDKMAEELTRNSDFQMYGDTPRKIGDKWDVDPAKLMSFAESENLSGTYSVEFVSIEEFQGKKCAVLEATFNMKGQIPSEGGADPMNMELQGTAVARRSIVDMVDLDVEVDGTMTVKGSPAENVELEVKGPIKITEKNSLGKK